LFYGDFTVELKDMNTLRVLLIVGNHWIPGAAASTAAVVIGNASFIARRHGLYRRWLADDLDRGDRRLAREGRSPELDTPDRVRIVGSATSSR